MSSRGRAFRNNRNVNRKDLDMSSSRDTALSTTVVDSSSSKAKPDQHPASDSAAPRGSRNSRVSGGIRYKQNGSSTSSTNTNTKSDAGSNILVELGRRSTVPSADSTVDHVTSVEFGKAFKEDADENDDRPPREFMTKRQSVRRIWKNGPGDNADSEQVGKNEPS